MNGRLPLARVLLLSAVFVSCERDERPRLAAEADVVFVGTNAALQAATVDVDDVADLAVVQVERVLAGAPVFAQLAGRQVTLRLRDPAQAREGDRKVYYATGWEFGESIGLLELGSTSAPAEARMDAMQSDIERFRQQESDRQVAERLRSAELVVRGTVTAVRSANVPRTATEHDPDWQEADIAVTAVLRGAAETRTVTIWFPGTDDVMWYGWPRFQQGVEGVWSFRPFEPGGRRVPRLTAQRGDSYPVSEEARIRRLLR